MGKGGLLGGEDDIRRRKKGQREGVREGEKDFRAIFWGGGEETSSKMLAGLSRSTGRRKAFSGDRKGRRT